MSRPKKGSAYERTMPDGSIRWVIKATRPDGTRTKPAVLARGTTEKQARAEALKLSKLVARGDLERIGGKGPVVPKGGTIADLAKAWLRLLEANPDLAPSTKERHGVSVNKWIVPKLGSMAPAELKTADLRGWIREYRAGGASPSSIRKRVLYARPAHRRRRGGELIDAETKNACRHPKVLEVLPVVEAPEEIVHFTEAAAAAVIFTKTTPPERRMRQPPRCAHWLPRGRARRPPMGERVDRARRPRPARRQRRLAKCRARQSRERRAPKTREPADDSRFIPSLRRRSPRGARQAGPRSSVASRRTKITS